MQLKSEKQNSDQCNFPPYCSGFETIIMLPQSQEGKSFTNKKQEGSGRETGKKEKKTFPILPVKMERELEIILSSQTDSQPKQGIQLLLTHSPNHTASSPCSTFRPHTDTGPSPATNTVSNHLPQSKRCNLNSPMVLFQEKINLPQHTICDTEVLSFLPIIA